MDALVFYISGLISVAAAILVVTRRNPVYSTIYLVLFFIMISLDFLILRAPFLAIVQVLVYGGAIMVLFLFVIMLLNLSPEELRETVPRGRKVLAGAASFLVFILLAVGIRLSPTVRSAQDLALPPPAPVPGATDLRNLGETAAIGQSLFTTHTLAFEYTSVLILVAILGAIYLTKKKPEAARRGVTPGLVPFTTPQPPPVTPVGVGPPAQSEATR
ncbi:MAG TPA: NADH-quinone oxidoreductase subunit J [Planctomycetota bacterium]|nr:NADH-quinone oxidoreductase subunit J [Planctomycetota bacterium]